MRAPRSKPSRLTRMNSAAGPWNHVAIIQPSSCQTVAKRSQSPASRQTAQFSTSSRIAKRSPATSAMSFLPPRPCPDEPSEGRRPGAGGL